MRVFVTKAFRLLQRKERLDDIGLLGAIARAERGLIDADLGHGLIKQRVAREGKGRSGGYRTIIAYRSKARAVFLFGFAKNHIQNIGISDERLLSDYGAMLLALDEAGLKSMLAGGELREIEYREEA